MYLITKCTSATCHGCHFSVNFETAHASHPTLFPQGSEDVCGWGVEGMEGEASGGGVKETAWTVVTR